MRDANLLVVAVFLLLACITLLTVGLCATAPGDQLPCGFMYLDSQEGSDAINLNQVILITPTWDSSIALTERTPSNREWTHVKTIDDSIFTLKETMEDFMARARDTAQGLK